MLRTKMGGKSLERGSVWGSMSREQRTQKTVSQLSARFVCLGVRVRVWSTGNEVEKGEAAPDSRHWKRRARCFLS